MEALQWFDITYPIILFVVAYVTGGILERRHFEALKAREAEHREFPVTSARALPADWQVQDATLLIGSVVVSADYFKRIIAWFRGLVGGRVSTYEPLLDRARREALMRLVEQARGAGFDAVINVRLESSRLASGTRDGQGTTGVEMLAYGTAIRRAG